MTPLDIPRPDPRTLRVVHILSTYGVGVTAAATHDGARMVSHQVRLKDGTTVASIQRALTELACHLEVDACTLRVERGKIYIDVPAEETSIPFADDFPTAPDGHFLAGVDAAGQPVYVEVASMPSCIVAGCSGAGKSVFLRVLIDTLRPYHVVHVLDPKGSGDFPGWLGYVWGNQQDAEVGLGMVYDDFCGRLNRAGARTVFPRNDKIVLIVDEFQTLLGDKTTKRQLFEILSMGRGVGVHCVLATQSPSAAVIGNEMRVNCPTRIVLKVASASDSRVALGEGGAEKLLGRGDALLKYQGRTIRVQVPQLRKED